MGSSPTPGTSSVRGKNTPSERDFCEIGKSAIPSKAHHKSPLLGVYSETQGTIVLCAMARVDFVLNAAQRVDAREALRALDGSGISLAEAARRAVTGRLSLKKATVAECVDLFVRARLLEGLRQQSVDWYENKLSGFVHEFGAKSMDDVSRAALRTWLGELQHTANTTAAKARAVRAFWRWAMAQEPPYAGADITSGLRTSSQSTGDIGFLPVDECSKIMAAAGDYRSALALMLFAGVRPGEVWGQHKEPLAACAAHRETHPHSRHDREVRPQWPRPPD